MSKQPYCPTLGCRWGKRIALGFSCMFTGGQENFEGLGMQVNTISANTTPTRDTTLPSPAITRSKARPLYWKFPLLPLLHLEYGVNRAWARFRLAILVIHLLSTFNPPSPFSTAFRATFNNYVRAAVLVPLEHQQASACL